MILNLVRFVRYLIVGAAANLTVLGIYWLASLGLGLSPKLSLTIASAFGFLIAYCANRMWSFEYRGAHAAPLARYALGYFLSYCLQLAILNVGTDVLGYPHQWVVVFGLAIAACFFFALQKFWIFPRQHNIGALSEEATSWDKPSSM
jgi:putative flippase GtrA